MFLHVKLFSSILFYSIVNSQHKKIINAIPLDCLFFLCFRGALKFFVRCICLKCLHCRSKRLKLIEKSILPIKYWFIVFLFRFQWEGFHSSYFLAVFRDVMWVPDRLFSSKYDIQTNFSLWLKVSWILPLYFKQFFNLEDKLKCSKYSIRTFLPRPQIFIGHSYLH